MTSNNSKHFNRVVLSPLPETRVFVSVLLPCTWTPARCCLRSPWHSLLKVHATVDLKGGGCGGELWLAHASSTLQWKLKAEQAVLAWFLKEKKKGRRWHNRYAYKTSGLHTQNDNKIVDPLAATTGFWSWSEILFLCFKMIMAWVELTRKHQQQHKFTWRRSRENLPDLCLLKKRLSKCKSSVGQVEHARSCYQHQQSAGFALSPGQGPQR